MEFRDLKAQYLNNRTAIDNAIQSVLLESRFIGGEPVRQLEEKLAEYVGVRHCITCANGTDALQLALMAWGIGENDAVFVPDFTFFSTAEVVPWVRAVPVFVDVDADTFNMSAKSLEEAILAVTDEGRLVPKAVIAVDLFGQPADFPAIRAITQKYDMLLLEDGAQGFGGKIGDKMACSFGDISTTSFFPAKPLGCYGDGGAVFTNNDEWAELIESYKVHGKGDNKYDNVRIGLNSRLDTIQAAILLAKFGVFVNEEIDAVNETACLYSKYLSEVIDIPAVKQNFVSSWAQYTIKMPGVRDRLKDILAQNDIPSMVYYPKPLHEQKVLMTNNKMYTDLNTASMLSQTVLSLPMHPYMSADEIDKVAQTILKVKK